MKIRNGFVRLIQGTWKSLHLINSFHVECDDEGKRYRIWARDRDNTDWAISPWYEDEMLAQADLDLIMHEAT